MELRRICPSVTDLYHVVTCPQGLSMLSHIAGFPSFLRLNNITVCRYTAFYFLFIYPLMDI